MGRVARGWLEGLKEMLLLGLGSRMAAATPCGHTAHADLVEAVSRAPSCMNRPACSHAPSPSTTVVLPPARPCHTQAVILQGQVKAQADKDVANYEAEWRQLTDIVEQDRRAREAQRAREIAAREQQMAALFKQEFSAGGKRRGSGRGLGASGEGGKPSDGAAAAAANAPERVKQLKEAFARVLVSTGAGNLRSISTCAACGHAST